MKAIEKEKLVLQAQLRDIQTKEKEGRQRGRDIIQRIEAIDKELKSVPLKTMVTDHAIVQYLRRPMEQNIDLIVKKILSFLPCSKAGTLMNGEYPVGEGHRAVVMDNKVVTIK